MLLHLTRRLLSTPPLKTGNYFEVFSITPTFKLDLTELSRVYKRLQAEFHPDKHANSSALEQENAAQTSALINEANKCLKDPYCRARLLLKIQNFDPNVQTMDMEFLSDMMDVNDEVEMCEDRETLSRLKEVNEAAIAELYVQFEEHFNANELKTAAERLAKVKFLLQTRDRIDQQAEFIVPWFVDTTTKLSFWFEIDRPFVLFGRHKWYRDLDFQLNLVFLFWNFEMVLFLFLCFMI